MNILFVNNHLRMLLLLLKKICSLQMKTQDVRPRQWISSISFQKTKVKKLTGFILALKCLIS